jgi:lysophospholipase L1-like esterase
MISHTRGSNHTSDTRILLISPPPVYTFDRRAELASRDPPAELDRDFEVTKRYAEAVGNVAKEEGVAFVDVWTKIWEAAGKQEIGLKGFLRDGLHLNAAGYDVGI